MRCSILLTVLPTILRLGLAAPASPLPSTPALVPVRREIAATMALPDAVSAVNQAIATVEGGSLQDTGVLDDIERLLDIIATHVERIRAATSDTSASSQLADALAATDRAVAAKDTARNKAAAAKEKPEEKPTIIKCKGFGVCNPVTLVQDPNGEWNQINVKALDPEKLSWKKPWSKKKGGN